MALKANKKCPVCKKPFVQFNSMRQKVCGDVDCALEYGRQQREKEDRKQAKKALREFNKNNKRKSDYIKEAQTSINKYARLRDWFKPCISCDASMDKVEREQGWKTGGCWDAGHFLSRGAHPQLRFNLKNINKQCKKCNGGSGKFSHKEKTTSEKYRENLILKIGLEAVELLECDQSISKCSPEYFERVNKIFNKKSRILEKRLGLK